MIALRGRKSDRTDGRVRHGEERKKIMEWKMWDREGWSESKVRKRWSTMEKEEKTGTMKKRG